MQAKRQNKFRAVITKVSSSVGHLVSRVNLLQKQKTKIFPYFSFLVAKTLISNPLQHVDVWIFYTLYYYISEFLGLNIKNYELRKKKMRQIISCFVGGNIKKTIYKYQACLSVCLYPINPKTPKPIEPNFFCDNSHEPRKSLWMF